MTPEEVEARFQRIEAILVQTAECSRITAAELAEQFRLLAIENAERDRRFAEENAERDRREEDREERMELMMIGINALVESSAEYKSWKVETDQRFDILLQEVRTTNQRVTVLENQ